MSETPSDLPVYPRLNPAYTAVIVDDDEVHFTAGPWNNRVFELIDEDRDGKLGKLVAALDGQTAVGELLDSFTEENRNQVADVLRALQQKSIVRDTEAPVDDSRAKIGGYLSLRDTEQNPLDRLDQASLYVIGAGPVGRTVVSDLISAGVGDIRYTALDTIAGGRPTAPSSERVTRIETGDLQLDDEIEMADFAIVALDRPYPTITSRINRVAHSSDTPWISTVVNNLDGQVGPTVYPGETACYECFRTRAQAATASSTGFQRYEQQASAAGAVLPSIAHVVAGMAVVDVLTQLAGGAGKTVGSVINFDFADYAVQADEVLRMPRCDVCGHPSERLDSSRHVTLDHLTKRD